MIILNKLFGVVLIVIAFSQSINAAYLDEFSDEAIAKFNSKVVTPIDITYPDNYFGFFWAPRFYSLNLNNWFGLYYDHSFSRNWGGGFLAQFDMLGRGQEVEVSVFYVNDRNLKEKKSENVIILSSGAARVIDYKDNSGSDYVPFLKVAFARNMMLGTNSHLGLKIKPNINVLLGKGSYSVETDNVVFQNRISNVAFGLEIGMFFWTEKKDVEK